MMKVNKTLIQIAATYGVSVTEVRRDIHEALDAGWNNPDPQVQEYWRNIPCKSDRPTMEEVIRFMANETKRHKKF